MVLREKLKWNCFRENAFNLIHVIWQPSPLLFSLSSSSCQSSLWDVFIVCYLAWSLWQHVIFSLSSEQYSFVRLVSTSQVRLIYVFALLILILHSCHRTVCMFLFAILGPCVSVWFTWHGLGMSCLFMFYRSYSNTYVSSWEPHLKSLKNYPHTFHIACHISFACAHCHLHTLCWSREVSRVNQVPIAGTFCVMLCWYIKY